MECDNCTVEIGVELHQYACRKCRYTEVRQLKFPTLKKVLGYKNDAIIARILKDHNKLTLYQAELLFQDTLCYLWLANKFNKIPPPPRIDKVWHIFIIFMKDYEQFCYKYFGRMIYHRPRKQDDKVDDIGKQKRVLGLLNKHMRDRLSMSRNWRFK